MPNGVQHKLLGDKVALYRRPNSSRWHCSASIKGRQYRASTKQESLKAAKDVAHDWYMELLNKDRFGELASGKTFREAAKKFELEYEVITNGRRSPKWVQGHNGLVLKKWTRPSTELGILIGGIYGPQKTFSSLQT